MSEHNRSDSKARRNALGKGLEALIPQSGPRPASKDYRMLPIAAVRLAPAQPRTNFDARALDALAASIRESGVLQPLVVREVRGHYELIAGERRLRASKMVGLKTVPVIIKDVSDKEAFTLALIENIQRQDLNPIEEAHAYKRLVDEYALTQDDVAQKVGMSRAAITNSMRLLQLPGIVQEFVVDGSLSAGHARTLVTLPEDAALRLAQEVIANQYSVRETERMVRTLKDALANGDDTITEKDKKKQSVYREDAQIRSLTEQLQQQYGVKIKIKDRRGKGRIEIHYDNYDIFQSVFEKMLNAQ